MLKFEINGKNGTFELNLPTSLNEITPEYLKDVTSTIQVADNYSLIGICYREAFSTVIFPNNTKKKNLTTAVVPLFVKCGKSDNDFINNINTGDKLIIAPSQIALGHHVNAPRNLITINNILNCINGDTKIYQETLKTSEQCYFLEFKLVPNVDINGVYKTDTNTHFINPFVTKVDKGA